ncbi:MAG: acetylxylan esterase [Lentisphaeria bacterium]|nr:acetylxylan esterase [Lentisphaeria bacterium]
MKKSILILLLAAGNLLFGAAKINGSVNRPNALFKCGENAVFTVSVTENGKPVAGKVNLTLSLDGKTQIKSLTADLDAKGKAVISGTLNKPGFLRLSAEIIHNNKRSGFVASAGFEVEKIRPAAAEPADFDRFWANALKKSAALPSDLKMEKLEKYSTALTTAYKVSISAPAGKVYGFLRIPNGKAPFPMIVSVPGAGAGVDAPEAENNSGVASLMVNIHNYDPMIPGKTIMQSYRELTAKGHYIYMGYENVEKSYLYRAVIGINRMIDAVSALPEIDGKRLGCSGSSQGGGFGLILAGLVPGRFRTIVCNIPALCDISGYKAGRSGGWPAISENTRELSEKSRENFAYFDAASFGKRIKNTRVVVIAGLADTVCSPSSIHAMYNTLGTENKKIIRIVPMPHQVWANYLHEINVMREALKK